MMPRKETLADGIELWLGDCREVLPTLGKVDLVFADPPYGVNGAHNSKTAHRAIRKNDYSGFTDSVDYVQTVAVSAVQICFDVADRIIVTPGNRCLTLYPEPDSFGAIYQPASVGLQAWGRADAQPILYYGKSPYGGKGLPSRKCSWVCSEPAEANGHPCPKPIGLIKSIIDNTTLIHEQVCDPFMGSGTTGVACVQLGRKFIGIELDPKYFDIACRRISDELKRPRLDLGEPVAKPVQEALI